MAYMKDATGRRLDDFAVAPARKPTIILFGDSRTDDCDVSNGTPTDTTANAYSTNMSWFDWGQAAIPGGPVFDVIRNSGQGGDTTTGMLARIDADVIAHAPGYMTLWGGTNDNWSTTADVDASYARMVTMMERAHAAGIYVFLISETTKTTPTGFAPLCQYYNERLRRYASTHDGVEFWDFNERVVNPASSVGGPLSTMVRDGIHLSAFGASTLGQQIVAKKLARFPSLVSLPNSLIDTMGNNTSVRNALSNPLMTTTGGTNGAGDTGTLPSGWTATQSGSNPTAVHSTPARADGFGNDLRAVITASGSGAKFYTATVSPARVTPGVPYVLEAAVALEASTNLAVWSFIAQLNGTPANLQRGWGQQEQSVVADNIAALASGVWRSRIFTVPAGTTLTSINLVMTLRFGAAGSATVRLGRVALKRVD